MSTYYEYSEKLNRLLEISGQLPQYHATRYKPIVDRSEWGIECKYAKKTQELSGYQKPDLERLISDVKQLCIEIEEYHRRRLNDVPMNLPEPRKTDYNKPRRRGPTTPKR